MVSCAANPGPSRINLTADSYLDTTGGIYNVNIIANVSDASGNPVADGTVVDFTINVPGVSYSGTPTNYTHRYYPILTGGLNGNNSQFASVPTSGGKAAVRYGWFPNNKIPTGFVMITAALNNSPSVKSTLYLEFSGTTNVSWSIVPTIIPTPMSTPISASNVTATPSAETPMPSVVSTSIMTPKPTPLSPMVTLLSLIIGAAMVSAATRK